MDAMRLERINKTLERIYSNTCSLLSPPHPHTQPNLIGHGSPPPSQKPHPPISSKERTRKATVVASQKDAMNRLFLGLGANPTTNNPTPETNENNKFVRRGSQYKGRKKSVVIQQLLKEKESMLGFLDKLVKPVDVGINQNLH